MGPGRNLQTLDSRNANSEQRLGGSLAADGSIPYFPGATELTLIVSPSAVPLTVAFSPARRFS
jgi:hypothetical protein